MTDFPKTAAVRHDAIIEHRHLDFDPATVYRAFVEPDVWGRWFRLPGSDATYERDLRVGGEEVARSVFRHLDGREERLTYRSRYLHLQPDACIVYGYQSLVDDLLRWTSLVSVELVDAHGGTQLTWTEQVAFVTASGDGAADFPHLHGAVRLRLNGLASVLTSSANPLPTT